MKRFEQMEQRRFAQEVAPNIDEAVPAPVRGPVRLEPPKTQLPDISAVQTALQEGARLTVQLVNLRKNAEDKADELAQIEFDGWVRAEQTRRSTEFAALPIAEQNRLYEEYRTNFTEAANAKADELGFSLRRRQVVGRMITSYGDQFGARMYAESTRALEKRNIEMEVNNFRGLIENADVQAVGPAHDKLTARGIDPGMTRNQAISRAAYNNLLGQLPQLTPAELSERVDEYARTLEGEQEYYDIGGGAKIGRKDLTRLRENADTMLYHKEREENAAFYIRVADGTNELTVEDVSNDPTMSPRQKRNWIRVLKAQEAAKAKAQAKVANTAAREQAAAAKRERDAAAAKLKLSADATQFSADNNLRIKQLREFHDRAAEALSGDPVLLVKTIVEIDKTAEASALDTKVWNSPVGQQVKSYLDDRMYGDNYVHTQDAIRGKFGKTYDALPPELQQMVLIRQCALVDSVKQMVRDGARLSEIKKVIDDERTGINSAVISEYLAVRPRFVKAKDKQGREYWTDPRTGQVIAPVKEVRK